MTPSRSIIDCGGAGYIGSHMRTRLARDGYVPVTFDNLSTGHRDAVKWGRTGRYLSRTVQWESRCRICCPTPQRPNGADCSDSSAANMLQWQPRRSLDYGVMPALSDALSKIKNTTEME